MGSVPETEIDSINTFVELKSKKDLREVIELLFDKN